MNIIEHPEGVIGIAFGFLVEMLEDILHYLSNTLGRTHRFLAVDTLHFLIFYLLFLPDGIDIIDAERQHVLIVDGIHDGVGMQLVAKRLLGGLHADVASRAGVLGKDGRTCKTKQMVFLEMVGNGFVHLAEIAAVALVEDDHHLLLKDGMVLVFLNED